MRTLFFIAAFAAAFWGARWAVGLPHMLSNMSVATVGASGGRGASTQSFDNYAPGVSLATLSGWTVPVGSFVTIAGGSAGGSVAAGGGIASYEPFGFPTAPNHEVEVTLAPTALTTNGQWHGAAVAVQADGKCYFCARDSDGYLYYGYYNGTSFGDYMYVTLAPGIAVPFTIRLRVTGTGTARRVSCGFNDGTGWTEYPAWQDRDFGPGNYIDGGKGGIIGWNNSQTVKVDNLTIRNK